MMAATKSAVLVVFLFALHAVSSAAAVDAVDRVGNAAVRQGGGAAGQRGYSNSAAGGGGTGAEATPEEASGEATTDTPVSCKAKYPHCEEDYENCQESFNLWKDGVEERMRDELPKDASEDDLASVTWREAEDFTKEEKISACKALTDCEACKDRCPVEQCNNQAEISQTHVETMKEFVLAGDHCTEVQGSPEEDP